MISKTVESIMSTTKYIKGVQSLNLGTLPSVIPPNTGFYSQTTLYLFKT